MSEREKEKGKNALVDENVSTQIDRIFWKSGSCFKGTNQHKRYTLLFYVHFVRIMYNLLVLLFLWFSFQFSSFFTAAIKTKNYIYFQINDKFLVSNHFSIIRFDYSAREKSESKWPVSIISFSGRNALRTLCKTRESIVCLFFSFVFFGREIQKFTLIWKWVLAIFS